MGETGRLDSWKAIADYLGRDVATARRWEKTLGLPVRRVPGGRGHSVFAFVGEIDAWLAAGSATREPLVTPPAPSGPDPQQRSGSGPESGSGPGSGSGPERGGLRRRWQIAAALVVLAATGAAWVLARPGTNVPITTVQVTPDALRAVDAAGRTRWTHAFDPDDQVVYPDERSAEPAEMFDRARGTVLFATSFTIRRSDKVSRSGELVSVLPDGSVEHQFTLDDQLTFGAGTYAAPWTISDFRVNPFDSLRSLRAGPTPRVAVAAHHYQWWPSTVTLLDSSLTRIGTFVNPGWVLRVHWLSPERLLLAGFSNDRDGAMLSLVDTSAFDGQAPATADTFRCASCGAGRPARYVVLPRSELNRVTGSPFNRIVLEVAPGRFSARTIEVPATAQPADVLYEFTADLEITRATYSDRYWEVHRTLEANGTIAHTRAECPERDGPRSVERWEPATGWRTIPLRH